jgi:3',5'-cyclic AMP phosphodiesterase CpdA
VRRRGPLALIGLSSSVPSLPLLAVGRLGAEQLRRLALTLERLGQEQAFRVVLIHHPPRSKPSHRFKRLLDGPALCAVLAQHGAELVIHGHNHVHSLKWLDGPHGSKIAAVGVPSASEAPPGKHDAAGYNLYRVSGTPGAWRCEVISRSLADDGTHVEERRRAVVAGK